MVLADEVPPLYRSPSFISGLARQLLTRALTFDLEGLVRSCTRFTLAAMALARTGIIIIRSAASQGAVDAQRAMADTTWKGVENLTPGLELPHLNLSRGDQRVVRGYKNLVETPKPVVNFMHGEGDGMMDLAHLENLVPQHRQVILDCLHEDLVKDLAARAFGASLEVKCRNLYVNRGVQNTRFIHCDGEAVKVKSFVYFNAIQSFHVGPYYYLLGSHRGRRLRQRNQSFNARHQLNKHEYRLSDGKSALPVFCRAGDMVVSAQHGAHRGFPQASSARRTVLVNVHEPAKPQSSLLPIP